MKFSFVLAFIYALQIFAGDLEPQKYHISCPRTDEYHSRATAVFKKLLENDFVGWELKEDLRKNYAYALEHAEGLDRAFIHLRYASSLWRMRPFNDRNLRCARSQIIAALYILEKNVCSKEVYERALFEGIRIYLELLDGNEALALCHKLIDLEPDNQYKLFAYRTLTAIYFSNNELNQAQKYLNLAKAMEENNSTDLRNEAKLTLMNNMLPMPERLKKAEELVWQSYKNNKNVIDGKNNYDQIMRDVLLLFSLRMANDEKNPGEWDAYSMARKWLNMAEFRHEKFRAMAKRKLDKALKDMIASHERPLSKSFFDTPVPTIRISDERLKEVLPVFEEQCLREHNRSLLRAASSLAKETLEVCEKAALGNCKPNL